MKQPDLVDPWGLAERISQDIRAGIFAETREIGNGPALAKRYNVTVDDARGALFLLAARREISPIGKNLAAGRWGIGDIEGALEHSVARPSLLCGI
jgi:hypothetical protein